MQITRFGAFKPFRTKLLVHNIIQQGNTMLQAAGMTLARKAQLSFTVTRLYK
jgi:hypothetical protein